MIWPSLVRNWGTTPAERADPFPCDGHLAAPDHRSRIVVKLLIAYPRLPHGPLLRLLGPPATS